MVHWSSGSNRATFSASPSIWAKSCKAAISSSHLLDFAIALNTCWCQYQQAVIRETRTSWLVRFRVSSPYLSLNPSYQLTFHPSSCLFPTWPPLHGCQLPNRFISVNLGVLFPNAVWSFSRLSRKLRTVSRSTAMGCHAQVSAPSVPLSPVPHRFPGKKILSHGHQIVVVRGTNNTTHFSFHNTFIMTLQPACGSLFP